MYFNRMYGLYMYNQPPIVTGQAASDGVITVIALALGKRSTEANLSVEITATGIPLPRRLASADVTVTGDAAAIPLRKAYGLAQPIFAASAVADMFLYRWVSIPKANTIWQDEQIPTDRWRPVNLPIPAWKMKTL